MKTQVTGQWPVESLIHALNSQLEAVPPEVWGVYQLGKVTFDVKGLTIETPDGPLTAKREDVLAVDGDGNFHVSGSDEFSKNFVVVKKKEEKKKP